MAVDTHSKVLGPLATVDGDRPRAKRFNVPPDNTRNGLAQLVLAIVKLLHELLERQAIRRMENGSLTEAEIERLGVALMKQAEELDRLREAFNLSDEDLNIDLGPLGSLS